MGSSSHAPPPNPELERVQIDSLRQQMDIAKQQEAMQAQLQPLQMQSLQFGLDSQKTAFAQSQEDRTYALAKRAQLDTAMQPFIDKATNFDESARRAELQTETNKAIQQSFGDAANQQARTLGRAGFSTTAPQQQAMEQQSKMAEATARAGTGHAISAQAKQEGVQAQTDLVNMLAGYPAQASQLATTGANIAAGTTQGVNAGVAGIYAPMSAASKIFGQIGQQAGSLWNTQASAKLNADMAAANSNAQMWGAAAGVAMTAVMMSDRRLKENIRRIGETPTGLSLYMFNFKGKAETEIGVMADEVEEKYPDAVFQVGLYKAVDYSRI